MENKSTRRAILKTALFTSFFVPFGYILSVSVGDYVPREGFKIITDKEATIFESAAEVIIPNGNQIGLSIYDVDLARALDNYMLTIPQYSRSQISLLLFAVEHILPIRRFYFKKFSRISFENRRKLLKTFDESGGVGGRALVRAIKGLSQTLYYNDPRVASKIGFVDRCVL